MLEIVLESSKLFYTANHSKSMQKRILGIVLNNCGRHKTDQNLKFCKQTEKMIELAGFAPKDVIVSYKV